MKPTAVTLAGIAPESPPRNVSAAARLHLAFAALAWAALLILWRWPGIDAIDAWELPIARAFNALIGRSAAFDQVVIFLNKTPGEAASVLVAGAAYLVLARGIARLAWRRVVLLGAIILLTWVTANFVSGAIESVMRRDSPSILLGAAHRDLRDLYGVRVKTVSTRSFPSSHGIVFFTMLFMCRYALGKRAWWLLPLVVLLALPRVFAGAHWPSDVLVASPLVAWPVSAAASLVFSRWMGAEV